MAVGRARYLEMAVDMALSLRDHSSLPVALASDGRLAARARARYPEVFDHVTEVPARFLFRRAMKYGAAAASPFEEALFIDADCLVLSDPDRLWSVAGGRPLVMVGSRLGAAEDGNHHGFSTRALMTRFALDRYLKTNSGVFYLERSGALELLDACLACYRHEVLPALSGSWLHRRFLGDELGFGIVGGRREIGTFPIPGPMYWPHEIEVLDLATPIKPILHMISAPRPHTLAKIVELIRARRRAAGLPPGSARVWRDEARRLRWCALRDRMLNAALGS
jgi:hypothetical protein